MISERKEGILIEKFVLIFGPQAVGKMTVGQALTETTDLKLLHNHMTIELLEPLFGFSPTLFRLSKSFRNDIFQEFVKTEHDGLVFTFVWAFDLEEDWQTVEEWCHIFEEAGVEIYFVELEADVNIRLERNKTHNRLKHKPTKRNIEQSEDNLLQSLQKHRFNSYEGEIKARNYLRINNASLSAEEVAKQIKDTFGL